jgi:hypothetical protein
MATWVLAFMLMMAGAGAALTWIIQDSEVQFRFVIGLIGCLVGMAELLHSMQCRRKQQKLMKGQSQ